MLKPMFIQVCDINYALEVLNYTKFDLAAELGISRSTLNAKLANGGNQLLKLVVDNGELQNLEFINKA